MKSSTSADRRLPMFGEGDTDAADGVGHHSRSVEVNRQKSGIMEFASYGDDWDGDGAKGIPMAAVQAALDFSNVLERRFPGKHPTGISPSPDGEIFFYWKNHERYAEVNFEGDGGVSLCWEDEAGITQLIENRNFDIAKLDSCPVWKFISDFLSDFHQTE